eukprot:2386476-Pleurochrysis_carterae.AAC.1
MLTPDSPIPSEPYDPRDPSCAGSTSRLPPGYVKPRWRRAIWMSPALSYRRTSGAMCARSR